MKSNALRLFAAVVLSLIIFGHSANAQNTVFTYQGRLNVSNAPATGNFDVRFGLFSTVSDGAPVTAMVTNANVAVSGGLFSTTVNFGAVFTGTNYWLEIAVRPGGSSSTFVPLTPRDAITPTPYAMFASSASGFTGVLSSNNLPPTVLSLLNASNPNGIINDVSLTVGSNNPVAPLTVVPRIPTNAAGLVTTAAQPLSLAVAGRLVYVVTANGNALQIFDASNPTNLTVVGSASTGANTFPVSVAVAGRFAYVVNYTSGTMEIFDVSNPANPLFVSVIATGANPYSVAVSGRYVYVVNFGASTLQVFDVNNPSKPVVVGNVATGAGPVSIALSGRYAYVGNFTASKLQIFDLNNPASPVLTGSVASTTGATSVAVAGRYAALASTNSLQIIDVNNPATPVSVSTIAAAGGPRFVAMADRYVYVANEGNSATGLQIYDISTPATPLLAGTMITGNSPAFVAVSGRFVYVVNYNGNSLQVFDLGGAFFQQLEAGAVEAATLQTRDSVTVGNSLNVRGGLTASGSARISGGLSVDNGKIIGDGSGLSNLVFTSTTSTAITNFTGPLAGDVTGTQSATVVSSVGGTPASSVAAGANAANSATSFNSPNTIVSRDASGNFSAGVVTGTFLGDGRGLVNLTAPSLVGVLPDGTLSGTYSSPVQLTNSANVVAGSFVGNGSGLTNLNVPTSVSFSGSLNGDVTGQQNSTVVVQVGGVNAGNLANAANTVNAATSVNVPNSLVRRDGSGAFSAGNISGTFSGNGAGLVNLPTPVSFSGSLSGDVTGPQNSTIVAQVGGASAGNIVNGVNAANSATSANIPNTLIRRDINGAFSAGNVSGAFSGSGAGLVNVPATSLTGTLPNGALSGTYSNAVQLTNAANILAGTFNGNGSGLTNLNVPTAVNFSGSLSGDVTGSQNSTVVTQVGGVNAGNLANAANTVNAATSINAPNTLVTRDGSGSFSGGNINGSFSGNGANLINLNAAALVGSIPNNTIAINSIQPGQLAVNTFSVVTAPNSGLVGGGTAILGGNVVLATTGTPNNVASALVSRDLTGAFSAGNITATFTGNGGGLTNLNATNLTGTLPTNALSGTYSNAVQFTNVGNVFVGNGAGLTNLPNSSGSGTATNFSGALNGDVTGNQTTTVVTKVGDVTAANVASGANAANAATPSATANTIVSRDATGGFSAGNINASFTGNGFAIVNLNAANLTGLISPASIAPGSIGNAQLANSGLTVIATSGLTGGGPVTLGGTVALGTSATPLNTPNAIVSRDGSGAFTAGNITASFTGNGGGLTNLIAANLIGTLPAGVLAGIYSNAVQLTNVANVIAGTFTGNGSGLTNLNVPIPVNFSGALNGDVTGNQTTTVVAKVGGVTAANVASGANAANAATPSATANTIVSRDATGNFSGNNITGTFTGNFSGNGFAIANLNAANLTGLISPASIAPGSIGIGQLTFSTITLNTAANSGLTGGGVVGLGGNVTIGSTATSAATANSLVSRDGTGSFTAGTITASFTGNGGGLTNLSAATLTGTLPNTTLSGNYSNVLQFTNAANVLAGAFTGAFTGDGNALTNLKAANLTGTLPASALSGTYSNAVQLTNVANVLVGDGSGLSNLNVATAVDFTGSLNGDVTGSQNFTVVQTVDGASAFDIANATFTVNSATPSDNGGTLVLRDTSGNVSANTLTLDGNLNLSATSFGTGIIYSGTSTLVNASGEQNIYVGKNAGNFQDGFQNTGLGDSVLQNNTSGNGNTAVGTFSLVSNGSGTANTGVGAFTLSDNFTGNNNTAVGIASLGLNDTGSDNTAVGINSLANNLGGGLNVAVGSSALANNTTGFNNVAVGAAALEDITTTGNNTAIGYSAGLTSQTGSNNIFLGAFAGDSQPPDASGQFIVGSDTAPINSFVIGSGVTSTNPTGVFITTSSGIGDDVPGGSLTFAAGNSTGVGSAGSVIFMTADPKGRGLPSSPHTLVERMRITSDGGVGIGTAAPSSALEVAGDITADNFLGTFQGNGSGLTQLDVSTNTAASFSGNLFGDVGGTQFSTFVQSVGGVSASDVANAAFAVDNAATFDNPNTLVLRDDGGNIFARSLTLDGNLNLLLSGDGSGVIFAGGTPLLSTAGSANTFLGLAAGNQPDPGVENTALGNAALGNINGGNLNTAVGASAMLDNTIGSGNTAVGAQAGSLNDGGSDNIFLGFAAGDSADPEANNQFIVGSDAAPISQVYLGNGNADMNPVSVEINVTAGAGPNIPGASLTLAGGNSTGSAPGGAIIFLNAASSAVVGTDTNTLTEAMRITNGKVAIGKPFPNSALDVNGIITATGLNISGTGSGVSIVGSAPITTPRAVAVAGRYAYVGGAPGNAGFKVFDFNNPASPVQISSALGPIPIAITVAGRYAYCVASTFLETVDIKNPANPVVVASVSTIGTGTGVAVSGHYAYVGDSTLNQLRVFDTSDPLSLAPVANVPVPGSARAVAIAGQYLYILTSSANTLQILDISNPAMPVMMGSIVIGNAPSSLAVSGRYVYLVNSTDSTMQIVDVGAPASPVIVSTIGTAANPASIIVADHLAYVACKGGNVVQSFDVSNPISPAMIGSVNEGNAPVALAVSGRFVIAANQIDNTLNIVSFGGTFLQQLEVGSLETATLQARDSITVGNALNVGGSLTADGGARISGGLGVAGGVNILGGLNVATNALFISPTNSNVGIGTTNPTTTLQVNGSVSGVGPYINNSDARYKKNITPLTHALDKILALHGVQYDWRTNEFPQVKFDAGTQIGFVAQQLKEVLPEAVVQDASGYYSVAYSEVIPVLVEAMKDQQSEIAIKNAELQQLKAHDAQMESRLAALENALKNLPERR